MKYQKLNDLVRLEQAHIESGARMMRPTSRAEELIADLEAEIVKRDARIAELEHRSHDAQFNVKSLYKRAAIALSLDPDNTSWFEIVGDLEKVTAMKEQQRGGVVLPERCVVESVYEPCDVAPAAGAEGWNACLDEVARLNQPGECVAVPRDTLETALDNLLSILSDDEPLIEELRALLAQQGKVVGDE